ncbi:MAG: hypothetical protein QN144_03405 [Armatimonadota bacterium]|nr:hypothetical protein [Armatimonadota bacterium]MDR7446014.1 hypothetical protein [Armatimonadota bacterium]MDR7604096.1 hypothetical protein [Armatimonadota bacterium]
MSRRPTQEAARRAVFCLLTVTYFDCVGFQLQRGSDLEALAEQAARLGQPLATEPGFGLRRWQVGDGVELWAELGPAGQPLGLLPFFETGVRHRAAVVAVGHDPQNPEEGWGEVWLDPTDPAEPYSGRFPLVCDLVDFLCVVQHLAPLPAFVDLELVCFADAVVGFRDILDWGESQHATGFRLPPRTFASTWHTSLDEGADRDRPEATAWIAGTVERVERRTNPLTHRRFVSLQVDVGGVVVDLVAPEDLAGGLEPGWLVQAGAWILARIPGLERPG